MITNLNNNFYNTSSYIQSNSLLNRAGMETCSIEIPFILMANNKDERTERIFRNILFVSTAFVAPVLSMPILNKFWLKKDGIIKENKEVAILKVSKDYLKHDSSKMIEGFQKTAEELHIKDKEKNRQQFKDIDIHFKNVLNRFSDKEALRQKLIKTHNKIFWSDFLITSALSIAVPWFSNFATEKRTKRKGYVGEFAIADKNYTDKMTKEHEKNKKLKFIASCLPSILAVAGFYKLLNNSMIKPEEKLGKIGKFLKKNAGKLNYKDAIFMSRAGYCAVMLAGEMPVHFLASRDKHELKMRVSIWSVLMGMMFGGDFLINNIAGRICDKKFGTTLMNRAGFEKASFFKKFLMEVNSFDKLNKMKNISKATKKAALIMYWGNFALTTALIGFSFNAIVNRNMKKDVKKDLEKQKINS